MMYVSNILIKLEKKLFSISLPYLPQLVALFLTTSQCCGFISWTALFPSLLLFLQDSIFPNPPDQIPHYKPLPADPAD